MTYLKFGDYPLGTTYDDFEESRGDKSFLDVSISYLEKAGKNHPKPRQLDITLRREHSGGTAPKLQE